MSHYSVPHQIQQQKNISVNLYKVVDNPEAIIQATNAGKRQANLLVTNLHCRVQQRGLNSHLPPLPPLPPPLAQEPNLPPPPLPPAAKPVVPYTPPCFGSLVVPFHRLDSPPSLFIQAPAPSSSMSVQPPPPPKPLMSGPSSGKGSADNKAELNYICLLMEAQHNSMVQAQQDRAASAKRMTCLKEASAQQITCLEEAIMLLSTKCEDPPAQLSATAAPLPLGQVNLQQFCISNGLFQGVKQFLKWVNLVQLFFVSKGVITHDTDKIFIVGSVIRKFNVLAFYSNP
ncbi:hypothetical protein PCASD_05135 [Puccinia coronata f. sp. avenae]|uniref:Uncharacterized protein n=1 Tax=Puccinia coronata f. sp. avenae TaxID=200324 RepID=A0A2N5V3K2_9BASI|nr:hypothetical protein PCASD_05135 [Puccinia coronata f. sp. avenae]